MSGPEPSDLEALAAAAMGDLDQLLVGSYMVDLGAELGEMLERYGARLAMLGLSPETAREAFDATAAMLRAAAGRIEASGPGALPRAERRRRHRHGG